MPLWLLPCFVQTHHYDHGLPYFIVIIPDHPFPRQHIKNGHVDPPMDGRSERPQRDCPARDHARSFFRWVYDNLAEPLAEGDGLPEELLYCANLNFKLQIDIF